MRHVSLSALLLALMASCAAGAGKPKPTSGLTIILDFQGPHSVRSVAEMEQEAEEALKDSGLNLAWRLRGEFGRAFASNLVVVRFKGNCLLGPGPNLYDEGG